MGLSVQEKKRKIYFHDDGHDNHLGFPIGTIFAIFDLQVIPMLPTKFQVNFLFGSGEAKNRFSRRWPWRPSWISDRTDSRYFRSTNYPGFKSVGLSVQEKKQKIDFQDGGHGGHLGFPIGTILAIFDLQVTRCFLQSFMSIGLSVQEKKPKIDFQDGGHGGHLGFPIRKFLPICFYLQITPMILTRFQVNWPFDWIGMILFLIYKSPLCILLSFKSTGLSVQEKKRKINFQDGRHGGHLGFPIGTILAVFYLQVTSMLPTKFQVKRPFGSREEAKNRFLIGMILSVFDLQVTLMLPTKFQVKWPFGL